MKGENSLSEHQINKNILNQNLVIVLHYNQLYSKFNNNPLIIWVDQSRLQSKYWFTREMYVLLFYLYLMVYRNRNSLIYQIIIMIIICLLLFIHIIRFLAYMRRWIPMSGKYGATASSWLAQLCTTPPSQPPNPPTPQPQLHTIWIRKSKARSFFS